MYTSPFRLSGVTVVPFNDIFPARNSTKYLLEDPREPGTRLGNRAPEVVILKEGSARRPVTTTETLTSSSSVKLSRAEWKPLSPDPRVRPCWEQVSGRELSDTCCEARAEVDPSRAVPEPEEPGSQLLTFHKEQL